MKFINKFAALFIIILLTLTGGTASYSYFISKIESSNNIISIGKITTTICRGYGATGPIYNEKNMSHYKAWMFNIKKQITDELIKDIGDTNIKPLYLEEKEKSEGVQGFKIINEEVDKVQNGSVHNVVMFGSGKLLGASDEASIQLNSKLNIKITQTTYFKNESDKEEVYIEYLNVQNILDNLSKVRSFRLENNILKEYEPNINEFYDLIIFDNSVEVKSNKSGDKEIHIVKQEFNAEFSSNNDKAKTGSYFVNYKNKDK